MNVAAAGLGLGLTGAVAVLAAAVWGCDAALPAAVFGLVATAIQVTATRLAVAARTGPFGAFATRWAAGMLLRLFGVALIPVAVGLARAWFPPLPTALGYLGVLLPLLVWETRAVR